MNKIFEIFPMLKSTRFWSVVLIAVIGYLKAKGFIGIEELVLLDTILGGHVLLRTVDKTTENLRILPPIE